MEGIRCHGAICCHGIGWEWHISRMMLLEGAWVRYVSCCFKQRQRQLFTWEICLKWGTSVFPDWKKTPRQEENLQLYSFRMTEAIFSPILFVCFLFVFGWHLCPMLGHWFPCLGFLVMSPLGFKARVGSALFTCFTEPNIMYIPRDPPLVLHLLSLDSWQRSQSLSHMHQPRWYLAQIRTGNHQHRRQMRYHCVSDPARRG